MGEFSGGTVVGRSNIDAWYAADGNGGTDQRGKPEESEEPHNDALGRVYRADVEEKEEL